MQLFGQDISTFTAAQRMNTQLNKGMHDMLMKNVFKGGEVTDDQLLELYTYNMNIRRDTPIHDVAFEYFYRETERFAKMIATQEYHRPSGVPQMAVNFDLNQKATPEKIKEIADLHDSGFRVYTWLRNGHCMPSACIALNKVPDNELTDVIEMCEELAYSKRLTYLAIKASPLSWAD